MSQPTNSRGVGKGLVCHEPPHSLRSSNTSCSWGLLLASPSEWDVMEGTFVGYRCLQSDPLLWEEAGISTGYRTTELLRVPRCSPLLPVPHITAQVLTSTQRVPLPYFQPLCCCCQLVLAGSFAQAPLLCKPVGLTLSVEPSSQGT